MCTFLSTCAHLYLPIYDKAAVQTKLCTLQSWLMSHSDARRGVARLAWHRLTSTLLILSTGRTTKPEQQSWCVSLYCGLGVSQPTGPHRPLHSQSCSGSASPYIPPPLNAKKTPFKVQKIQLQWNQQFMQGVSRSTVTGSKISENKTSTIRLSTADAICDIRSDNISTLGSNHHPINAALTASDQCIQRGDVSLRSD